MKSTTEAVEADIKKFSASVVQDGVAFSASRECKRLLELSENTGKKFHKKSLKREQNRTVRKIHYWMREPDEKFFEIKCKPAKLPKGNRIRDQYLIFTVVPSLAWEPLLFGGFLVCALLVKNK